jgi:hypothetical protein
MPAKKEVSQKPSKKGTKSCKCANKETTMFKIPQSVKKVGRNAAELPHATYQTVKKMTKNTKVPQTIKKLPNTIYHTVVDLPKNIYDFGSHLLGPKPKTKKPTKKTSKK